MSSLPKLRLVAENDAPRLTPEKAPAPVLRAAVAPAVTEDTDTGPAPFQPPAPITDIARSSDPMALWEAWHDLVNQRIEQFMDFPHVLTAAEIDGAARDAIRWNGFPRGFDARLSVATYPERMARSHRSAEMLSRFVPAIFRTHDGDTPVRVTPDFASGIALYPEVDGVRDRSRPMDQVARPQDEFLEWHVVRDGSGRITRMDFSTEMPEYWATLGDTDPRLVGELYGELLKTPVVEADLFHGARLFRPVLSRGAAGIRVVAYEVMPGTEPGRYNKLNPWNTVLGCVHGSHPSNALSGILMLLACSTVRVSGLHPGVSDLGAALLAGNGLGCPNRHSDPAISAAAAGLVGRGRGIMARDPVGVFVESVDLSGLCDPSNMPIAAEDVITYSRSGTPSAAGISRVVRFSISPPPGADYGLESCSLGGHPLTTGGPVARRTRVHLPIAHAPVAGLPIEAASRSDLATHPRHAPAHYIALPHGEAAPGPDDFRWNEGPALAPEMGSILRAVSDGGTAARRP